MGNTTTLVPILCVDMSLWYLLKAADVELQVSQMTS